MSLWVYVYLPYSLAFMALGLAMAMVARAPTPILPRAALWLLAAFGILHGLHEWFEMALVIQSSVADGNLAWFYVGDLFFTATSFAFLLQSALELLIVYKRWPTALRALPIALLLLWLGLITAFAQPLGSFPSTEWAEAADALSRYLLGLTGSLLMAYALWKASQQPREIGARRIQIYLAAAALGFALYAFFTGVIVPPAPFPPASVINSVNFLALLHVPTEAFRAIIALAIGGFLAEACIVEAFWIEEQLKRLRGSFITIVTHNLRSPITSLNLAAGLLKRLPADAHKTEEDRQLVHSIETSARNLNEMADNLLDASRIEAKRLPLNKESMDLGELIHQAIDRAQGLTAGHRVRVFKPEEPLLAEVDPKRLEQAFDYLLFNAVKYADPGREILVEIVARPQEAQVSITSYGPGISPEEQSSLFVPFYLARPNQDGEHPGLDLSLYVAKGIIEAHGGCLWIESVVDRYATFRFILPRPSGLRG